MSESELIEAVKTKIEENLKGRTYRLLLIGSRARGDHNPFWFRLRD